jgi:cytosine/adenosine deaminase-related metal-dependent hydrolase
VTRRRYRARWILPISRPPVRDGWIEVAAGRVSGVSWIEGEDSGEGPVEAIDLGAGSAILPGLINAHTHLELSHLAGTVPPAPSMAGWIRTLLAARARTQPDARAIEAAIGAAWRSGTIAFGDISNTLASVEPLLASGCRAVVFHEVLGFAVRDPAPLVAHAVSRAADLAGGRVRIRPAPHAPYSVSPALLAALAAAADGHGLWPSTIHVAESAEEIEFLETGGGPFRRLLEDLGAWDEAWEPPGVGPVEYLDRLGVLGARTLLVHGVRLTPTDLTRLAAIGATVVTCPRSNRWTGSGAPPLDGIFACGVNVAIGTDSLASAPDLDLFAELAEARRLAPAVPASRLIRAATSGGATALGFRELGALDRGAEAASLITVAVPRSTTAVEEYLVGGIDAGQVGRLKL